MFRSQRQAIENLGLVNLAGCRWKGEIILLSANRSGEQQEGDRGTTQAEGQRQQ